MARPRTMNSTKVLPPSSARRHAVLAIFQTGVPFWNTWYDSYVSKSRLHFKTQAPFTQRRNRSVVSRTQKIHCSHGNGTITHRLSFLFTRKRNCSVPKLLSQFFPFFPAPTTSTQTLLAKVDCSIFGLVLHLIACNLVPRAFCHIRTETKI